MFANDDTGLMSPRQPDLVDSTPPDGPLPDRFRDPVQIPGLVRALIQDLSRDNVEPWIRRLLAGDMDVDDFFTQLADRNQSSVCAYSFRSGEPAYQCSTCGVDPTCIQCAACFRHAQHTGHDVKMTHAGGGGICDCGDSSSWAPEGFCSQHRGHGDVDAVDTSWLPSHTIAVFETLIDATAKSILQLDDHYMVDKEILAMSPKSQQTHIALLQNDDVHSFNDIITLLQSIASLPERVGLNIALKVDYYQRAVFAFGPEARCRSFCDDFSDYDVGGAVELRPVVLLAEDRVVQILSIVTDLCSKSDALRRLACDLLSRQRGSSVPFGSYMTALMHGSSILSRTVSDAMPPFHFQLFVSLSFKEAFTMEFTRYYRALNQALQRPSHSQSRSVLDFSVQLYTIPDMVLRLCRSQDLLGVFLEAFRELLEAQFSTQPMVRADDQDEALIINGLRDLVYIVTNQGVCHYIFESRPDIVRAWLDILHMADGLDNQQRQTGVHVDYESIQWWSAFRLAFRLHPASKIFLDEFSKLFVDSDLDRIIVPVLDYVSVLLGDDTPPASPLVDIGNGFQCTTYDITRKPVSMHFPLRRFVIELTARFALAASCPLGAVFRDAPAFVAILDHLMRAVAFIGHIRAGLWVLNGSMLVQQAATYERIQARDCMFDPDMLALQCSAALMGPKPFLTMFSYRFLLHDMFFPGLIAEPAFDASIEPNKIALVVDFFLHILVAVVIERSRITDDKTWGLRREIVHWLMNSDLTHSDLLFRLGSETPSAELKRILPEVSRFVTPRDMESGKYQVKREAAADLFDPLFIKYTDAQRETATAAFVSQNHRAPVLPALPAYSGPFLPLFQLEASLELYQIVHHILSSHVLTSSRLVLMCLRLVGCGLRDAQMHPQLFPVGEFLRSVTFRFSSQISVLEMLCCFIRDDVEKARCHADYIRLLIDGLSSLSDECRAVTQNLLSAEFAERQQQHEASKAAERRRRRDAARAAALGAIQSQIEQFSSTHDLPDDVNRDDADDGALQVCILCRSNESQNDMGLLTWIGRYNLSDLLLPSDKRCRHRVRDSELLNYSRDCSHAIHLDCYTTYMQSLTVKQASREHYEGQYVIDLSKGEFTCPLCKSHANTLLPILQPMLSLPMISADNPIDTMLWIRTSLPGICQRLDQTTHDTPSDLEPANNCLKMFTDRVVEFIPNGNYAVLLAHNIAAIEIQLRDGSTLSDRQLLHLRYLIASASQSFLPDRAALLKSSLVPLNVALTTSLQFVVEFCLSMFLVGEPLESVLQLVRVGYAALYTSDGRECDENQYGHAASMNVNATRHELFTMPYLRRVSILITAISPNIPLPELNSHSALRQFLHLTQIEPGLEEFVQGALQSLPLAFVKPTLAILPQSFMALFDAATRLPCSNCGKNPTRPAVCLICSDIMCSSKDCGNGIGALTMHTSKCLGDQGLYLSINQGSIFLICNGFSCEFSSPYLDEYGEEDIGLHRGRPLFLDDDRYEKLRQMVVRLEIGSYVSRKRSYQSSLLPRNAI